MQAIKKLYRVDYTGEDIIKDLVYSGQEWVRTAEFVPNRINNNQISNQAVVIGNGPSRLALYSRANGDNIFTLLNTHKGGLLASGRLQSYGCNALARDFLPDFLVVNDHTIAQEYITRGICDNNIVYATAEIVLDFPNKFYLIPQNPHWNAGTLATYLACFDGHTKIFFLGFDANSNEPNVNYNVYTNTAGYQADASASTEAYFIKSLSMIMEVYSNVEFVRVMPDTSWYCPEQWKYQLNFRQISFNDFVIEADLG